MALEKFDINAMPSEKKEEGGKPAKGRRVTEEDLAQWKEWREQGISVAEIARRAGRQQAFVYQKLKKAGITAPPKEKKQKATKGAAGKGMSPKGSSKVKVPPALPQTPQPLNPAATKPRNLAELLGRKKAEEEEKKAVEVARDVVEVTNEDKEKEEKPDVQSDEGTEVGSSTPAV